MIHKILLISIQILFLIKINDGMDHTWEKDEKDVFYPSQDLAGGPPSPDEETFQELFGTPVDQINEEIHGESSTAGIQNVPMDEKTREKWAQDTFFQEYQHRKPNKQWDDLRNESYVQSWPILCYLLWDKTLAEKSGQECSAKGIYSPLFSYSHRVVIPNHKGYQVDVLRCKCPANSSLPVRHQKISYSGLFFFVSPCNMYPNSYYIMRQPRRALEVYDIRNTPFNPATDYNLSALAYQTDEHTISQRGHNEQQDKKETEKMARATFLNEFDGDFQKIIIWKDLRNKTHQQSWPELCLLLWDIEPDKKSGMKCKSKLLSKFYHSRLYHSVNDPSVPTNMYVDLLLCTCPKTVPFYVSKSCKIDDSYYILALTSVKSHELKVLDMRSVVFNPTSSNTQ